ncbi:Os06g0570400 [Oryza sativa Japonica Group]|uniref:Os06g0570400 protein n=1 Tax=Oryza sativa subsp. japonica TaxID=39947 RepID=A0A0P0WYE9_ORYSJ|nr:hypothetical protein EE612_034912 [Oryza sativa]BAS98311.1 Os06g0570400 [Oryza sativa Japonica Group]
MGGGGAADLGARWGVSLARSRRPSRLARPRRRTLRPPPPPPPRRPARTPPWITRCARARRRRPRPLHSIVELGRKSDNSRRAVAMRD